MSKVYILYIESSFLIISDIDKYVVDKANQNISHIL
jgi:hypothetical protein